MIDKESVLNLATDAVEVKKFLSEHRSLLDDSKKDTGVYWLTLHPKSKPDEDYFVRIRWASYPQEPPSVRFVTAVDSEDSMIASWPVVPGYRAPNDICKAFTAEGYVTHPEWRNGPEAWVSEGNPFLQVAHILQFDLNSNYGGRAS